MTIPAPMLRRIVTPQSPDDAERIFAIACLSVAADGRLAAEELAALRVLNTELRGAAARELTAAEAASRVDEVLNLPTREERLGRLRALADALSSEEARHCAYKVSVVTALADLATADEEFEFDIDVQDALKLSQQTADRLTAEVHEALIVL